MRSGESGDQQPAGKGRQPVVSVSQSSRCLAPSSTGARVSEAAESNKSWPDNNFTSKRSIKLSNEVSLGHCHGQRVAWLPLLDQHTRSLQEDGAQGRLGRGICYFVVITTLFLLDTKTDLDKGTGGGGGCGEDVIAREHVLLRLLLLRTRHSSVNEVAEQLLSNVMSHNSCPSAPLNTVPFPLPPFLGLPGR